MVVSPFVALSSKAFRANQKAGYKNRRLTSCFLPIAFVQGRGLNSEPSWKSDHFWIEPLPKIWLDRPQWYSSIQSNSMVRRPHIKYLKTPIDNKSIKFKLKSQAVTTFAIFCYKILIFANKSFHSLTSIVSAIPLTTNQFQQLHLQNCVVQKSQFFHKRRF